VHYGKGPFHASGVLPTTWLVGWLVTYSFKLRSLNDYLITNRSSLNSVMCSVGPTSVRVRDIRLKMSILID